ncbi:RagB/SusD family nutrient uptake outer membrane protein [Bacteroidota bacterium]
MKRFKLLIIPLLALTMMLDSCEEYLNIPPEADISQDEIFGSYESFQGFQDLLAVYVVDYNRHGARANNSIAGECLAASNYAPAIGNDGNYKTMLTGTGPSIFVTNRFFNSGLYSEMWKSVRIANMCLEKLDEGILKIATEEQGNWLKGQALFYRAFFHYEYVRGWGTIPYVDEVSSPDEQNMKRHWTYEKDGKTYKDVQAVFERIAEDFEEAATYLPDVWPAQNINWGRPTSLAALGFKAKALLFSASPLFNEQATGMLDYDKELLDRCAVTCQEVIDLAISLIGTQPDGMAEVNEFGLTDSAAHRTVFATTERIMPGTTEVLFRAPVDRYEKDIVTRPKARSYGYKQITDQAAANGSQMYLDKFEMKDGSRYKIEYDQDPVKRWDYRDQRFRFTFYLHNDPVDDITCEMSASDLVKFGAFNSNCIRKFYPDNVTLNNLLGATYSTPLLRLPDIYLTYAEAVFESTGSYNTIPSGLKLSAEDAVNIVRARVGQPEVATALPHYENNPMPGSCELASDPAFRLLYRNERAVELAYEGVYWHDIRRWKRAHLKDGVQLQIMKFDVAADKSVIDNTVTRSNSTPFVFKDANYWMPFTDDLTRFTSDWEQNPGW